MTPAPSPHPRIRRRGKLAVAAAIIGLGALWLLAPARREVLRTTAPHTAADVERVGGARTVGQSFVAPSDSLAEIELSFRPPVPDDAFPIIVHLRHGRYTTTNLRTVVTEPSDLTADGRLRAHFAPVPKSRGRPYLFIVNAPEAPSRSLAIYQQVDGSIYREGNVLYIDRDEDRSGDLEFALFARAPRGVLLWRHSLSPFLTALWQTPPARRAVGSGLLTFLAIWIALRLGTAPGSRWTQALRRAWGVIRERLPPPRLLGRPAVVLGLLVAVNVIQHIPFVLSYPIVNDEGAYLMDLANLRDGYWPFRDTLTKGPLFLAVLAPWVWIFPQSILAARLVAVAASAVEAVLLYHLGWRLWGRGVGLLAATLWTFSPTTIAQTSQLFLQAVSLPLALLGLVILVGPRTSATPPLPRRALLAGLAFAAAYLARASSLAFLAAALLLAWTEARPREALRASLVLLGTVVAALLLTSAVALPVLGGTKTSILLNLEAFTIGAARAARGTAAERALPHPEQLVETSTSLGSSLARSGVPLLALWLAALVESARRLFRLPGPIGLALFTGITVPFLSAYHERGFFLQHLARFDAPFITLGATLLVAALAASFLFSSRGFPPRREAIRDLFFLGLFWLALAVLYARFGRFRQQYHLEFLPFYVLGGALFVARLLKTAQERLRVAGRRAPVFLAAAVSALVVVLFYRGTDLAQQLPHTGSISLRSAREVAAALRQYSRPGEEVFTGQPLFPYLADRPILFGASHPSWYLEERAGTIPATLRRVYFPDRDRVRATVRERIRLAVTDVRTNEVYLRDDPALRQFLEAEFTVAAEVHDPLSKTPIRVWVRRPRAATTR